MGSIRVTGPVIDVHTHLVPDFSNLAPVAAVEIGDGGRLLVDGRGVDLPGLYEPQRLADWLASHRIDAAWVSAPPPTYRQGLSRADTDIWVRALDEGMRARLAGQPSLGLLSYLPLDQPDVAVALATDLAADRATVGWTAAAGGRSVQLDDRTLEPLWQVLQEADRPLLLHPGESPDRRLERFYLSNLLGNPVESGLAAAQLLLGGVLERHNNLKVLVVHCGGVVPGLVGRWARGVGTRRPGIPADTADPRVAVRSLWADTLAHSAAVVDLALSVFGPDRLVLGSDYPFAMGIEDPFESIAHLAPSLRAQIAHNAAVLLPASAS
jgi:aminocarboxymuconate-semialdehyde decarboxylase